MEYLLSVLTWPQPKFQRVVDGVVATGRHLKDHFIPHARNNYHPHALSDRALALFSGLLVCAKIFTISLLAFGPIAPAFSSAITEQNIIALTNESRSQYHLAALQENASLDKAAQAKADDMLAKGYFAHTTPDGKTPWDFIVATGYNYLMAGENLAVNFTEAENVETAWMNSPGHKANILNKNFEQIGIGISQGQYQGHTAIFVVQMFGTPAQQPVALSDAPTPVQATPVPAPATVAAVKTPVPELVISEAQTQIHDQQLQISATLAGEPVKVLAYFGQQAIMLSPKSDGQWFGQIALADLANGNLTVRLAAQDLRGQTANMQLADFSNTTTTNFDVLGASTARPAQVSWLGWTFDPKSMETKFYLIFVIGLLSSMVLAIGLKRHIQHLNLIVNGSMVAMLACVLWMAG
ncbi:MAG: hypothetical protein KGJ93_02405 [Patescibacteria group bacterium]|nr:hypothetical protein [Patescibacteria group bacterium]